MATSEQPARLRFEDFELDLRTRELRKDGLLVKLQDQPLRLLSLLANRPGDLVTRTEIEKELWGEDTVVEFEHSINTAMRKIREALGDNQGQPRFIETLPRKGYRFIARVEPLGAPGKLVDRPTEADTAASFRSKIPPRGSQPDSDAGENLPPANPGPAELSSSDQPQAAEEFALPRNRARYLFLLIQAGFLAMYTAALYKVEAIEGVLGRVHAASAGIVAPLVLVTAMCGIAVRLYLISAVGFDHPEAGKRFPRLFPWLFLLDALWSASPLLLVREIGIGLALGSAAALAYLPFAQRTLIESAYPSRRQPNESSLPSFRRLENASSQNDGTGG